jgi:tellurite resistance protein TehA-like permease
MIISIICFFILAVIIVLQIERWIKYFKDKKK